MNLTPKRILKYTRLLVLFSMIGSGMTLLTGMAGLGEFYPFANWKLYTQPLGSKNKFEEYRIYTLSSDRGVWVRQPILLNSDNFTRDEYVYTLNRLTNGALSDTKDSIVFQKKLYSFIKFVGPAAKSYKVVKETYQPLKHLHSPQSYDTLTVIHF